MVIDIILLLSPGAELFSTIDGGVIILDLATHLPYLMKVDFELHLHKELHKKHVG